MPASSHMGIKREGFPAPVVTTETFSSAVSFATSSAKGDISMMLTPKGLSVRLLARSICFLRYSASAFMAEIIPRPPPLDTAAASLPSEIQAIPPWKMGYSMPKRSHRGVFIIIQFILSQPLTSGVHRRRWKARRQKPLVPQYHPAGAFPPGSSRPAEWARWLPTY